MEQLVGISIFMHPAAPTTGGGSHDGSIVFDMSVRMCVRACLQRHAYAHAGEAFSDRLAVEFSIVINI